MPTYKLLINSKEHQVSATADTPLLWVLRDNLGLTGTKYSCGIGVCGACTVHLDGEAVRACTLPVAAVGNRTVTTIEALAGKELHPVQSAWIEEQVAQCGYCQPGQIMAAVALLKKNPNPSDSQIDQHMAGNLCRCGTYVRVRRAIHKAANQMKSVKPT